jgi:hypothetical protein
MQMYQQKNSAIMELFISRRFFWHKLPFPFVATGMSSMSSSGSKHTRDETDAEDGIRGGGKMSKSEGSHDASSSGTNGRGKRSDEEGMDASTFLAALFPPVELRARPMTGGPVWRLAHLPEQLSQFLHPHDDAAKSRIDVCVSQLSQALGKSEMADVRFKVRGVWVASGHKGVLSGRSQVFARMFANETEERDTGVVNMNDVTAKGLGVFLQFVYLGKLLFFAAMQIMLQSSN